MKIADISRGVILGGRFKLVDFLGDGSFGYVWKAEVTYNTQDGERWYATTELHPEKEKGSGLFKWILLDQ